MRLRNIRGAKVSGRRVIVRVDYNVAVTTSGRLRDTTRLDATLPTLRWLLQHGARIIIVSHRGRPHGRDRKLSLQPILTPLQRRLGCPVTFVTAPLFSRETARQIEQAKTRVILLENIRYEPGEEDNSTAVAKRLASFADLAVNDAFADSHRAHASIVGLARYLRVFAGLNLTAEITTLEAIRRHPRRPYVAIIGGAKISTKLGLIRRLLYQADAVLLGGALANTLLQAEGVAVGASLTEPTMLKAAGGLHTTNTKLKIPCDVVVAKHRAAHVPHLTRPVGKIGRREIILDIGPDTVELYRQIIRTARTVVWNGPMGVYEFPPFDRGTLALAKVIARQRTTSIAGGGETIDAIRRTGMAKRFTFLSTGGGAMVEFLEGKRLPGVAVVTKT